MPSLFDPEYRKAYTARRNPEATLAGIRAKLEQDKFNSDQGKEKQAALIKQYPINPAGAVAEWNRLSGKDWQHDPADNTVFSPSTGERIRVNAEKGTFEPINPREAAAGNALAQIRGSGGVKPGQDPALVEAFSRAGGTPELRAEAQGIQTREADLQTKLQGAAPTTVREIVSEADRRNLKGNARYQFIRDEQIALVGGKAGAAATAQQEVKQAYKLNEILSTEEANSLGLPYGTTRIASFGKFPLTSTQRDQLSDFSSAETIIDDIADVSSRVNTFEAGPLGVGRAAGAAATTWGSWTQTNEDASLLDSKIGELSLLVRAMGEKGTLATKDVDRVAKLVPNKTDTKGVAIKKIASMRAFIDTVKDKKLTAVLASISKEQMQSPGAAPPEKPALSDPLGIR